MLKPTLHLRLLACPIRAHLYISVAKQSGISISPNNPPPAHV